MDKTRKCIRCKRSKAYPPSREVGDQGFGFRWGRRTCKSCTNKKHWQEHKDDPEYRKKMNASARGWKRRKLSSDPDYAHRLYLRDIASKRQSNLNAKERNALFKAELVMEAGGGCCVCGYNRNLGALSFHHREGETKITQVGFLIRQDWDAARKEAAKCDLYCANCHAEHTWPQLSMDN